MKIKFENKFNIPSSYSILILLTIVIGLLTFVIPQVENASLSQVFMAPVRGFEDSMDISLFILIIGGFLGIVKHTGALDAGIHNLVKVMKGREIMLIPILMFIFSLGGTTYGMLEETIAFYALIVATMILAKMDALVGVSTILLGAGAGVLGSTVNPFAIGVAVDALTKSNPDIKVDQGIIIFLGSILWISSLSISIFFVVRYAKKVKSNLGFSMLSKEEIKLSEEEFKGKKLTQNINLTGSMKLTLVLFFISFLIMVISLIPWQSFGVNIFESTNFLTGEALGDWYFPELQAWFFLCSIIIGVLSEMKEKEIIKSFINGASEMVSVILIIAISRGISVLLADTGFDTYILEVASLQLRNISAFLFAGGSYIVYILLSFLIPSTSGLATASIPTLGNLANNLNLSPEVMIVIFSAGSGIANLFIPTSGVIMGGLVIAKVEYSTWLKFASKILLCIFIANIIILSIAMAII
ncbi:MAG: YfcC family protein [Oscillospiraceae bacterium]